MLTFEILILIYKLFWHFTSKDVAILHCVSSKYHRMNHYRFLNISVAFERKILTIEELSNSDFKANSLQFVANSSRFTCQNQQMMIDFI